MRTLIVSEFVTLDGVMEARAESRPTLRSVSSEHP